MKILVTGANGYLGQGVVKALLDNGHSVVAADVLLRAGFPGGTTGNQGNALCDGHRPDRAG